MRGSSVYASLSRPVGGEWMLQLAVIVTGENSRARSVCGGVANLFNFLETHGRVSNSRLPACYSAGGGRLCGLRARISRCTNVALEVGRIGCCFLLPLP